MRNIRLVSDLHLEFDVQHWIRSYKWLKTFDTVDEAVDHSTISEIISTFTLPIIDGEKEDVLVIAGDMMVAVAPGLNITTDGFHEIFHKLLVEYSQRFKAVIYIMGNHEFYHGDKIVAFEDIRAIAKDIPNVYIINNEVVVIDDVSFVCSTMWASYDNNNPMTLMSANSWMNDHRCIHVGEDRFTAEDAYDCFLDSINFIFPAIVAEKQKGQKVCVVTHHGPSHESVATEFKSHNLNGAYVSNLVKDILDAKPDAWVHGHVHKSAMYEIGETAVFVNPRGYFPDDLNTNFNPTFSFSILEETDG